MSLLDEQMAILDHAILPELRGRVAEVRGLALHVIDLPVPVGAMVEVRPQFNASVSPVEAEVVGFDNHRTIVMPLGSTIGIRQGDWTVATELSPTLRVGDSMLGRVLDGRGLPLDGKGPLRATVTRQLINEPIDPLDRPSIDEPLATGVRAVDALVTVGRGQRVGVFSPPGVGKSTLLGMMAQHTAADVTVIALVGERGREVRDFISGHLADGLDRSVVVCAVGDEPPVMRMRAAFVATTIAEHFRSGGQDVLLIMDSVTRFCHAARQVGLAAGEPPATKGYTPSVFSLLPVLLERCGRTSSGSITGLYAVLVEGDEFTDPVADAVRGVLDGHLVLSTRFANAGHWPALDVVQSVSRLADDVTDVQQQAARREVLRLVDAYNRVEDLVNIGAYAAGSSLDFDLAIACKPAIDQLLRQGRHEVQGEADFQRTSKQLAALMHHIDKTRNDLTRAPVNRQRDPGSGRERSR